MTQYEESGPLTSRRYLRGVSLPAATLLTNNSAVWMPGGIRPGTLALFESGFIASRWRAALPLVALCLSACATPDTSVPTAKLSDVFATPEWAKFTNTASSGALRPVTPDELVTADGRCATMAQSTDGAAPPDADAALAGQGPLPGGLPGGVGLGMTECQVMQRTGAPERFDIGAEGTERVMTMTVTRGPNPGLYRFRGGRLVSVERIDVPAAPKPAKAKAKKTVQKQQPAALRGAQQ